MASEKFWCPIAIRIESSTWVFEIFCVVLTPPWELALSIFCSINTGVPAMRVRPAGARSRLPWHMAWQIFLSVCCRCCVLGTVGGFVVAAHADSIEVLAAFLKTTQSAQARFVQTVTTPARPGRAARQKKSSGHFSFFRPEHFRFDYEKPYAQSIVADGRTLWVYDKDIAQVSSKPLTQALLNTPAAVIAWAQDLKALEKVFLLEAQPMQAGLEWVKLTPVQKEGPMQFLRIGMRASGAGVALASLEMTDAFNQQSVLVFEDFVFNPKGVGLESFVFKPPPGVEVIQGE